MSEKADAKSTKSADLSAKTAGLEKWLDDLVNKQQPLQLPVDARKWIADNAWWIVLIGGVLTLWSAWGFWQAGHLMSGLTNVLNEAARMYGATTYANELGLMWYLALVGIVIQAVLMLLAVSKLKELKKSGWNLMFYVSLLNLVIGVIYLFVPGYAFGGLLGTLVGVAISWFFLFQVRSRFKA